jgi:hypothetical protein
MMTTSNDTLRKFANKHRINVIDTNKRAARHTGYNLNMFKYSDDYNKFDKEHFVKFETETLYTVEITQTEFERMAEFEEQVFNNMQQQGHYNLFETLMEQKRRERYLADKYPAVKKAYEQYSLMLKMAESDEFTS